MALSKTTPSKIKQFINHSIGVEDFNKDDGITKCNEEGFKDENEIEAFMIWKKFDKVRRNEGEEIRTFVNHFNTACNAILKKDVTISPSTGSFILVQKAAISEELERLVLHKIDLSKAKCYEEVSKSLIRIMGDLKKVNNIFGDEIGIAEKVEGRVKEVLVEMVGNGERRLVV